MDELDAAYALCPGATSTTCYTLDTREPRYIAQGCRRWTCTVCGPRRKAELVRRIRTGQPNRFITLTCTRADSADRQLAKMRKALPKLIARLRREYGEVEYVRMLEQCRDGYPHFHLLARSAFIPHETLKHHWLHLTGAQIVHIAKAHGRSTAYIAKYLGKSAGQDGEFSRQRLSVSRNFWPPREGDQQFIAFRHTRWHPQDHAAAQPTIVFERMRPGLYNPAERQPGDENPPELQLPDRRPIELEPEHDVAER